MTDRPMGVAVQAVGARRLVSPTLVGRDQEIALLAEAVSAPPAVAVVAGEAGIGKTRLVTELAARSDQSGLRFLTGGCLQIREPFPLGPLIEVVRAVGADLARAGLSPVAGALRPLLPEFAPLLPEPPPPLDDRAAERHRVFRALAEVLAALGPAVLVVEDLHWADEQTVEFLRYLLRDPPPKLSAVLTYRADEAGPEVLALTARLSPAIGQLQLRLGALAEAEAGALAAAILELDREVSEPFARELWRRTAGLPLALEELLALLRARGDLVRDASGGWVRRALDELDVPTGIRDQVWQRVNRLPASARSVVEAAAVLQVPVPLPVLSGTCPPPARRHRAGIEAALAAGVLVESAAGVGLRHLLAAQAVYEAIPAPRRLDLHARAATALRARPEPALGQVAHHLRLAGELPGWVETAEQAADQAVALGHEDEAVRLLCDVLRNAPLPGPRRVRLAVKLGRAALAAHPTDPGLNDLLSSVLELELSRPVRGELRLQLGMLLDRDGAAFPTLRRLAAAAERDLTARPALRAQAMVLLGFPFAPGVPLAEHHRWLDRVVETAERLPDRPLRTWLLGKVAMLLALVGDPGWRPITERVLELTGGTPRHHREFRAYYSIGLGACMAGDLPTAARLMVACQDGADTLDGGKYLAQLRTGPVLLDFCRGAWDGLAGRAADVINQLPGDAGRQDDMEMVIAGLALARGDLDRAGQWFETALPGFAQRGRYDQLPIPASGMLRLALGRGQVDQAVAGVRWLRELLGSVPFQVRTLWALPAMTEALVAGGELGEAQALVRGYAASVRGLDAPLAPAVVPHARGLLAAAAGRWRAAAGYLQAAARRYQAKWCPYEAAQAYEQAAPALHAGGEAAAAAAGAVRAALVTYQRLGADWDYSRAAGTARRLGLPVPARHRGGHHGYQGDLSPRERQVAELAAAGRTNPEIAGELFVSVNTVKKQLAGAMHKLGVPSRVALAARLAGDPATLGTGTGTGTGTGDGPAGP